MKKTTTRRFAGNEGAADLRKRRTPGIMKWITRASLIPLIVAFAAQNGWASSHASHSRSYHRKSGTHAQSHHRTSHPSRSYSSGVHRDSHGRIKRSASARHEFMRRTGYPHGRSGYVVDHIKPLKRGGSDSPSNMQWQTKAAAKAKDKWE
jgi:hypothetical protein